MARSRILRCGAALVLSGWSTLAAFAAESVRPVQDAMRPCPKHGAGFVHVPGSATCIRLSGRVAAGIDLRAAHKASATIPPAIPPNVARLAIDTRTDTDYGPVRTFVRVGSGHR